MLLRNFLMSCFPHKISFRSNVHFAIGITLFLMFFTASCWAQSANHFSYQNIGKELYYLEDKSATMSLEEVKKLADTKFTRGNHEILNFGNTSSAWWVKISYAAQHHLPLYLIIDAPNIEYIDAFTTDSADRTVAFKTGCLRTRPPNVFVRNNFMINLPVDSKIEKKTIYVRLKTHNILVAPIKLATAESVIKGQEFKLGIEYIYIGLLIGLLLFNLFLFLSIRDTTYLYYVLYVLTLSGYLLFYIRGYGFIFGDEIRIFFNRYPHVLLSFSVVASLLFCNKFLHLKQKAPKMLGLFYVIGGVGIILFFVSAFGFKHTATAIAQLLTVTVAVVAWIAGVMAYRNGHRPAKYYILAWFFIWVTVALVTLSLGGVIPSSEFTIQLVPIGSTLELLLLSFALGDRYKVIIKAEQQARDENLVLVRTQNQRLEEKVDERTLQLNSTIQELESTNAIKNKLFSIIAHDLRSPLNSLLGILSLSDMQLLTPDELQKMLKENKKTIKSVNNTLNNLLHWAQSQMGGMMTSKERFELKPLFEELLALYLPLIKQKDIQLEQFVEGNSAVIADRNQISLVLRNLIDNAIKFTPLAGRIWFTLESIPEGVRFSVENEVEDPLKIEIDNMMGNKMASASLGTRNEQGVGLGLLLCKEYIQNNGGTFHIHQKENSIKFSLVLPSEG
ncbi:GHKL domain-containing protein [Pedobacter chitinilyticus]|uniref:histidine kinase n=2 Tax=Pedobacter chitinilyticus TaxID=2233776 RepID=A0A3S3Q1J2_9SPHI|nr:GHKL domain-containing protein [Pedobacter chitinilyticus]